MDEWIDSFIQQINTDWSTYLLHSHCAGHWGQVGNKKTRLSSQCLHSSGGDSNRQKAFPRQCQKRQAMKINNTDDGMESLEWLMAASLRRHLAETWQEGARFILLKDHTGYCAGQKHRKGDQWGDCQRWSGQQGYQGGKGVRKGVTGNREQKMEHSWETGCGAHRPGRWIPLASTFPPSVPQLTWPLGGLCWMPLDRARVFRRRWGQTGSAHGTWPSRLCPHSQGILILVIWEIGLEM